MKNNNWTKKTVDRFNTDKKQIRKDYKPKEEQMKGTSISVWNGDVNGALRKLKKILVLNVNVKRMPQSKEQEKQRTCRSLKENGCHIQVTI
jgi:hypothetical protein